MEELFAGRRGAGWASQMHSVQKPTSTNTFGWLGERGCRSLRALGRRRGGWNSAIFSAGCGASEFGSFWRRVLHTCHHRTQVQTWLRLAGRTCPGDLRAVGRCEMERC